MKKKAVNVRYFKCGECGAMMTAYKSQHKMTGEGHIKTMWCPWCKDEKDFTQVKEWRL